MGFSALDDVENCQVLRAQNKFATGFQRNLSMVRFLL